MRENKVFLALIASMIVYGSPVYAQSDSVPVSARLASAKVALEQIVRDTPEKEIHAVAFFTNDMSLEDVRSTAQQSPAISVKGFRHGTTSYSGGYGIRHGETIEQAIANYKGAYALALTRRLEIETKAVGKLSEVAIKGAFAKRHKMTLQAKADFERNGLRIVGIEIYGKAKHLKAFGNATPFVRVIEPREVGKPQPAILPK